MKNVRFPDGSYVYIPDDHDRIKRQVEQSPRYLADPRLYVEPIYEGYRIKPDGNGGWIAVKR